MDLNKQSKSLAARKKEEKEKEKTKGVISIIVRCVTGGNSRVTREDFPSGRRGCGIRELAASCLVKGSSSDFQESADRFSCLPDFVAHDILSLLSIEDLGRTSVASKRFRQLCSSVPDLCLSVPKPLHFRSAWEWRVRQESVGCWMESFLALRNTAKIRLFRVAWCCNDVAQLTRICKWIDIAAACSVEELDLSIDTDRYFGLPFCLSLSQSLSPSLRVIRLNLNGKGNVLKLLPKHCFNYVQVLWLQGLNLESGSLSDSWVSSMFPSLKELKLKQIQAKRLCIASPSLECLVISISSCLRCLTVRADGLGTLTVDSSAERLMLNLYAPNLQNFIWSGRQPVYCSGQLRQLYTPTSHRHDRC